MFSVGIIAGFSSLWDTTWYSRPGPNSQCSRVVQVHLNMFVFWGECFSCVDYFSFALFRCGVGWTSWFRLDFVVWGGISIRGCVSLWCFELMVSSLFSSFLVFFLIVCRGLVLDAELRWRGACSLVVLTGVGSWPEFSFFIFVSFFDCSCVCWFSTMFLPPRGVTPPWILRRGVSPRRRSSV